MKELNPSAFACKMCHLGQKPVVVVQQVNICCYGRYTLWIKYMLLWYTLWIMIAKTPATEKNRSSKKKEAGAALSKVRSKAI